MIHDQRFAGTAWAQKKEIPGEVTGSGIRSSRDRQRHTRESTQANAHARTCKPLKRLVGKQLWCAVSLGPPRRGLPTVGGWGWRYLLNTDQITGG